MLIPIHLCAFFGIGMARLDYLLNDNRRTRLSGEVILANLAAELALPLLDPRRESA